MRNTLVCTTGASLIGTFKKYSVNRGDVKSAINLLRSLTEPLENREFGAEINSTASLIERGYLDSLQNLYLIVSDTNDGIFVGKVLKSFFEENPFGYEFNRVTVKVVEHLNDMDIHKFRLNGLRNLVREMAKLAKEHSDSMVINATGGYKAQIAFAVLLGQVFKIPVFYRFEGFNHVIELLPLPVELSNEIFKNYKKVFLLLECRDVVEEDEFLKFAGVRNFASLGNDVKLFIDRENIDGVRYVALNPLGEIYVEKVGKFEWEDIENCEFLISPKNAWEKFTVSDSEEHAKKLIQKYKRIIEFVLRNPLVDEVIVQGYSKNHTGNSREIKVVGKWMEFDLITKHGTLHMKILTKCQNERILEIIARNLKSGLEARV
ncbi:MAG: hypothetical protein DRP30_03675 [Thermotoga sp.]|nr:MAG: hypothetical protein DRP30_03675 [Thermotoga sp.]HDM70512.1 putative CRISPR-associated protein [Thermotogales bacterium]